MTDVYWENIAEILEGEYRDIPFETVAAAARSATRDVCRQTLVWEMDIPPIALAPGQYSYALDAGGEDREVAAVSVAHLYTSYQTPQVQARTLQPAERGHVLTGRHPGIGLGWPHLPDSYRGEPRVVMQWEDGEFAVAPTPDDATKYWIRLFVALMPSHRAPSIPLHVWSQIERAAKHGALQELYQQPQKPWGSARMANYHGQIRRHEEQKIKGGPGVVQTVTRPKMPLL